MSRISRLCPYIVLLLAWLSAAAQAGPLAELAEAMVRQGAKFSDDVGRRTARELTLELEQLSAKTSDDVVEQLVKRGGPGALKTVRGVGQRAPEAARIIVQHGEAGKLVVEQGKTLALDVFRDYGDDGVRVLIRQGSTQGERMLAAYGKPLAVSADRLAPENMARLHHWLPEVEQASPSWRNAFGDKLKQGGDDFVVWVNKRWKELAVAGGLTLAGITAYRVGDGIVEMLPNPSESPLGWALWWLPFIIIAAVIVAGGVVRSAWVTWIRVKGTLPRPSARRN